MKKEDWERVRRETERLFGADEDEWDKLLEEIDDPEVRREVRSLLDHRGPPTVVQDHSSPPAVPAGERIHYVGDYEILGELGRGGMGVVYRARQRSLDRVVALKMILAGRFADDAEVARFRSEAEAVASLEHPGIVPIFEVGEYDGHHYFSMAYVHGGSLAERIAEAPLPFRDAAEILVGVARAVEHAHAEGVVHRDLKPANILLTEDREPRITDFGLAKRTSKGDGGLTETGQILGTPSYLSPEQARGTSSLIGPSADVYALGAVLHATLTGRAPFLAATPVETVFQVLEQEPVSPRQLDPAVPRDLDTIVLRCLEKDPDRRYGSAGEFADELERFLRGEPIHARPAGPVERAFKWARRRPLIAGLSAALVLALVAGTGISMYFAHQSRLRADDATAKGNEATAAAGVAADAAERANQEAERAREQLAAAQVATARTQRLAAAPVAALAQLSEVSQKYRDEVWLREAVEAHWTPGAELVHELPALQFYHAEFSPEGDRLFAMLEHARPSPDGTSLQPAGTIRLDLEDGELDEPTGWTWIHTSMNSGAPFSYLHTLAWREIPLQIGLGTLLLPRQGTLDFELRDHSGATLRSWTGVKPRTVLLDPATGEIVTREEIAALADPLLEASGQRPFGHLTTLLTANLVGENNLGRRPGTPFRLFDRTTGELVYTSPSPCRGWSRDGSRILCEAGKTGIRVIEVPQGRTLATLEDVGPGPCLAFARDGRSLLFETTRGTVRLAQLEFDRISGAVNGEVIDRDADIEVGARGEPSPRGHLAVVHPRSIGRDLELWDFSSITRIAVLDGEAHPEWSADGRWLATIAEGPDVEIETGSGSSSTFSGKRSLLRVRKIHSHMSRMGLDREIRAIDVAPDGGWIGAAEQVVSLNAPRPSRSGVLQEWVRERRFFTAPESPWSHVETRCVGRGSESRWSVHLIGLTGEEMELPLPTGEEWKEMNNERYTYRLNGKLHTREWSTEPLDLRDLDRLNVSRDGRTISASAGVRRDGFLACGVLLAWDLTDDEPHWRVLEATHSGDRDLCAAWLSDDSRFGVAAFHRSLEAWSLRDGLPIARHALETGETGRSIDAKSWLDPKSIDVSDRTVYIGCERGWLCWIELDLVDAEHHARRAYANGELEVGKWGTVFDDGDLESFAGRDSMDEYPWYHLSQPLGSETLTAMSLHPDQPWLALASEGGQLALWHTAEERILYSWGARGEPVEALNWTADGAQLISGDRAGSLQFWDVDSLVDRLTSMETGPE